MTPHPEPIRGSLPPIQTECWAYWLRPLMEHPGVWHRFPRSSRGAARQLAYALRVGDRRTPPGRWEFTARGSEMWARYVGAG